MRLLEKSENGSGPLPPARFKKAPARNCFPIHTRRRLAKQAVSPCTKMIKGSIITLHRAVFTAAYGGWVSVCRGQGVPALCSCFALFILPCKVHYTSVSKILQEGKTSFAATPNTNTDVVKNIKFPGDLLTFSFQASDDGMDSFNSLLFG
jgi:hypothetical protein